MLGVKTKSAKASARGGNKGTQCSKQELLLNSLARYSVDAWREWHSQEFMSFFRNSYFCFLFNLSLLCTLLSSRLGEKKPSYFWRNKHNGDERLKENFVFVSVKAHVAHFCALNTQICSFGMRFCI